MHLRVTASQNRVGQVKTISHVVHLATKNVCILYYLYSDNLRCVKISVCSIGIPRPSQSLVTIGTCHIPQKDFVYKTPGVFISYIVLKCLETIVAIFIFHFIITQWLSLSLVFISLVDVIGFIECCQLSIFLISHHDHSHKIHPNNSEPKTFLNRHCKTLI